MDIEKHFKDFMSTIDRMFLSEADFQFNFGRYLDKLNEVKEVVFEFPVRNHKRNEYIDLVVVDKNNERIGIELKYNTRKKMIEVFGNTFELKEQGAHDLARVGWVKDVYRLEKFINKDKVIKKGFFIGLTNDERVWAKMRKKKTIDHFYRFKDSNDKIRKVKDNLDTDTKWFKKEIGKEPIKLKRGYEFHQKNCKCSLDKSNGDPEYYYSLIEVDF